MLVLMLAWALWQLRKLCEMYDSQCDMILMNMVGTSKTFW